jgi:Cu(I)/Ag(I) efflux system membrane protein CusA/SilA
MIGGIFTSFILELVVYPAIYEIWKWHFGLKRELALAPAAGATSSTGV